MIQMERSQLSVQRIMRFWQRPFVLGLGFLCLHPKPMIDSFNLFTSSSSSLWQQRVHTVEVQWLEHLLNYENMFETGVVLASEFLS